MAPPSVLAASVPLVSAEKAWNVSSISSSGYFSRMVSFRTLLKYDVVNYLFSHDFLLSRSKNLRIHSVFCPEKADDLLVDKLCRNAKHIPHLYIKRSACVAVQLQRKPISNVLNGIVRIFHDGFRQLRNRLSLNAPFLKFFFFVLSTSAHHQTFFDVVA